MYKDSIGNYRIKAAAYYIGAVDSLGAMSEPRALSMKKKNIVIPSTGGVL